jgi:hypothetical protein
VEGRSKSKARLKILIFDFVFSFDLPFPFSLAEFSVVGRANSPGKANLVLCARMAHQDVLVGNN